MQKRASGILNWLAIKKPEDRARSGSESETPSSEITVSSTEHKHRSNTLIAGISLISVGGLSLLWAYLSSSLISTFIGLGLTLWGVLMFYMTNTRQVSGEDAVALSLSSTKTLNNLITHLGYKGQPVFSYAKSLKGLQHGYVFIASEESSKMPAEQQLTSGKIFYEDPKGAVMMAPGQSIVDLLEQKLDVNFATIDFAYLRQKLPRLLIEELKLVDSFTLEETEGLLIAAFSGGPCSEICQRQHQQAPGDSDSGKHISCPLCSAVALVLSKTRSKPISMRETIIKVDNMATSVTYTTYSEVNN